MKIAVIDDERPARSELKHIITDYMPEAEIYEISSGQEALNLIVKINFDLLFIDINLGDIDGTTVAAMVKKILPKAEIVFATAYNNYAEKAFDVGALNYILKPFDPKRIEQTIDRFIKKKNESFLLDEDEGKAVSKISINCDKKMILLDIDDIVYIETGNRNCIVHTKSKDYTVSNLLNSFEIKLKAYGFFRSHKSYIINLKYVAEICPWFNNTTCIKMTGFEKELLPVGRHQLKELKKIFSL